jgi:predicted RNase H-like nuclease (RuvC/YqgF family)
MSNISKQEIISNLKDKISQFKSNFSKNKESRKEVSELNFEINRDALKHFYKNKQDE